MMRRSSEVTRCSTFCRLARDLMVQETILNDLGKIGVSILSVTDGDLLEDDPTRILVRQVMGAIAQYDKAMTVQKAPGGTGLEARQGR